MTIKQAEEIFYSECKYLDNAHAEKVKRSIKGWKIIGIVLCIIGLTLTIIGLSLPLETNYSGEKEPSILAYFLKLYGILSIFFSIFLPLIGVSSSNRAKKEGPNLLQPTRNLYLNYLKCEDMKQEDKMFYMQKLEELRNFELVSAMRSAGNAVAASTFSAIMFTSLKK